MEGQPDGFLGPALHLLIQLLLAQGVFINCAMLMKSSITTLDEYLTEHLLWTQCGASCRGRNLRNGRCSHSCGVGPISPSGLSILPSFSSHCLLGQSYLSGMGEL